LNLLERKNNRVKKATAVKEKIMANLEDDNEDLENTIEAGGKPQLDVELLLMHHQVAFFPHLVRIEATLFDCAPTMLSTGRSVSQGATAGNAVRQGSAVGNTAAKLNAAISKVIHAKGLKFHLCETAHLQYVIST
jgi:hypothetical protein